MKTRLLLLVGLLCSAGLAHSAPITYSISSTTSGSLNGVSFTNQLLTLTMNADTSTVTNTTGKFYFNVGTVLFNLAGIGSGTFTDVMEVEDDQTVSIVGFLDLAVFVMGTSDPAFFTYQLETSIGPITGSNVVDTGGVSFPTSAGALIINSTTSEALIINSAGDSTFIATLASSTPEPVSFSLLGIGLAAIAGRVRLRRRRD